MPANDRTCVHVDSGKADADKLSQPSPKPLSQLTSSPPLDMAGDGPVPDTKLFQGVRQCVCVCVCVSMCVCVCVCVRYLSPLGMLALESLGCFPQVKPKSFDRCFIHPVDVIP